MIEIDGSIGGGQIFRTALSMSAITMQAVKIFNIRAKRPKSGLAAQHLCALNCLKHICEAEVKGAKIGSNTVEFFPKKIKPASFTVNVSTAGSVGLVLSPVLLPALIEPIKLKVIGGTNVAWSPPIEFLQEVLFPLISKMGARFNLKILKRGYYPKGKGIVSFSLINSSLPLKSIQLTELGELDFIKCFSHCSNLPKEVAVNQLSSAKKELQKLGVGIDAKIECIEESNTIGSGITLIGCFSNGIKISGSALGKKGIPAVKIGKEAAQNFLKEFNAKKPVDSHLADQLIPFLAIASGTSKINITFLTEHTLNNIETVKKFLPAKISVKGKLNESAEIKVKGIALKQQN